MAASARLSALLPGARKELTAQVEQGFPLLPAGCHLELDQKTSEIVLESIRSAVPSRWTEKADELRRHAQQRDPVTLRNFLDESGLGLEDIYGGTRCFSDLREAAGLVSASAGD